MSKFSERLFQLRNNSSLTQEELSANINKKYNLDINKGMISKYEHGVNVPGFTFIDYVADYFGVTTDYLMGRSDNKYYVDNCKDKKIPIFKTVNNNFSDENIISYETVSDDCDFCIKSFDDSMSGSRIYKDDILFICKQSHINDGEIGVILISNETMVRRVYKNDSSIILHAENPNYKDLVFKKRDFKNINILGRVRYFKAEVK